MTLPPEQEALKLQCFHPNGRFVEFTDGEIEQSIADRFEKIACLYPDRVAIKARNLSLTYGELNRAADEIAERIAAQSVQAGEIVALLLEHGATHITAMLAVWKAGKIYVALDHTIPYSKNRSILQQCGATLIVTQRQHRAEAARIQHDCRVIDLDEPSRLPVRKESVSIAPGDAAYILFTSGSTSEPKGVVQNHRNLLHQIKKETNALHICAADRLILLRSCSAIGGVRIVLSALLNGAAVHPFSIAQDGLADLARLLSREEITIYDSTPTTFRQLVAHLPDGQAFPQLRLVRLSSEAVYKRDVELYKKHFSRDCLFVNSLGLTETAGSIRYHLIDHDSSVTGDIVPVGYAVDDMGVVLLDDQGHEVGEGEIGEIAVRSRFLAPGYWGNPELTRAKFVEDPKEDGGRLYHTGDLGKLLADGCLIYLGRKDFQRKVRGYTIDSAEIERTLLALGVVKSVAVVVRGERNDEQSLVAFVTPTNKPGPTVSSLRRALSEKLPDYMIPSTFVMLDALPMTTTGKIDRRALPAPDRTRPMLDVPFALPRSESERSLAGIWQEVLHIDNVGIDDNFYDLGGDSLRLAEVNRRAQLVLGKEISMVDMLSLPTIRNLAEYLAGAQDERQAVNKGRDRAQTRRTLRARRSRSGGVRT